MKYLIPSERPDVWQFITHVFSNKILPMKHAVRHTWLLHRLCTSRHILASVYHVHGKNCSITLKISELVLRPGSCLQNRYSSCISFWSTNHKKAKSWASFDTSVDSTNCSAKESAFGSFATSSALTSAANSSIALGCFSVFLRTHPSQTMFCTYH